MGFEALCATYAHVSYSVEFCTIYVMRKSQQDAHSFVPRSGCDRLINMVDNNHGLRVTVIRIYGPWEAASAKDRGPRVCSLRGEQRSPKRCRKGLRSCISSRMLVRTKDSCWTRRGPLSLRPFRDPQRRPKMRRLRLLPSRRKVLPRAMSR